MSLQFLADGILDGTLIGLGATGVTLTYAILRFANFAHGDLLAWGAYLALSLAGLFASLVGGSAIDPLSLSPALLLAALVAMPLTGALGLALDRALFRPLRRTAAPMTIVMASFGASMALRSLLEFLYTSSPAYYSRDLQIARRIGLGVRVTPDQVALVAFAAVLALATHLLLTRTQAGRAMQAVSENPGLAGVVGIDVAAVVRLTWMLGGALACAAGVMLGVLVQIRPFMGFDLLLPLFAAAILGGIGSVPGALVGGLVVGLSEAATVQAIGAEWRAAVSFLVLIAVLLVRPRGLFGRSEP